MKQQPTNLHGTAICIDGYGVLITGASGIGKTELGLSLILHNHQLIADDYVGIKKTNNSVTMFANDKNFGYMYIRGVGFMNIPQLYNKPIKSPQTLHLIIELTANNELLKQSVQLKEFITILDIPIMKFIVPIGNKRNLTMLSELIIKYYHNLQLGNDSHHMFLNNHN